MITFLSSLNDSELTLSYGQIIFPAGKVIQWGLNKDATIVRWS